MNPEITKLMGIVKRALAEASPEGTDLNPVIAKLSKEASLNMQEINRVVEWTNTLKQLKLFKKASDKTIEFDVASPKEVKRIIYGEDSSMVKEASAYNLDKKYNLPENINLKYFTKEASYSPPSKSSLSDYPIMRNEVTRKAYAEIDKIAACKKEAEVEKHIAKDRFMTCMTKIASNLDMHYSEKFSEFEQAAYDSFGRTAIGHVNTIQKMARVNNERLLNYTPKNVIKETENISLLKRAMDNQKLYQVYTQAEEAASNVQRNWNKRISDYGRQTI